MLRPLVRGQSRYEGSIGNSNGLFHRPRAPTPYRATWPPSPWCWGLPARPAPHALAGHSLERARGSLRHREPPRRPGTRGEPRASARHRRPAPPRTDSTGTWGRRACAAGAAAGRAAGQRETGSSENSFDLSILLPVVRLVSRGGLVLCQKGCVAQHRVRQPPTRRCYARPTLSVLRWPLRGGGRVL